MRALPHRPRWLGTLLACLLLAASASGAAASTQKQTLDGKLAHLFRESTTQTGGLVKDLTTGATLYSLRPNSRRLPASAEKVYTTSTALLKMGATARIQTVLYGVGTTSSTGVFTGTLYLRGGGDPTFGTATYDHYAYGAGATVGSLAANLRKTGITAVHGKIVGDETYFDRDRGSPGTGNALSSDNEGELSGLEFDRGFTDLNGDAFQSSPALFAAQQLVFALRGAGISVPKGVPLASARTPHGAARLTSVSSPTIGTLMELTNSPSDNYLAETLIKVLGARYGGAGSTAAGASVIRSALAANFGIHPVLNDGSGLSRSDRTTPSDMVTALSALAGNTTFTNSLAIGGVRGTMQAGLAGTYGAKRCRGKTGTLHDVANLVGYCTAADGHQLVFAFMMNGLGDTDYGHSLEYAMAVAVARYNG
jgi:serine-type D-Ala-D-Ala carboxypeptidase/endopeptidase (penicillin-binding protein 4)